MKEEIYKLNLTPLEKVYYAFYQTKKKQMYFNEIREKLKMSISSLQNALAKLEKSDKIIKTKEKGNVFFHLKNKDFIMLNFTKFDILRFNDLNRNVRIPLKEFLEKTNNVSFIFLFGSAAIKEEKKVSDIDLLIVIHNFDNEELNTKYKKEINTQIEQIKKSINSKSLYPLNLVFVNEREFQTRKDYLLEEAKKTGFCIYNQQRYYSEVLNDEN
jgi:predicted nucleotidyltransferase